ncbi:hypothetical protein Gohar_013349 [Gossypium harknessii]|uniref:Uncharacterized protein n=1 Tax=Gossypium harknessii TaxID=34285 RepID=A0A7J9GZR1_9ROSI|nr:hypothetical protein [Gossypium harknessii]
MFFNGECGALSGNKEHNDKSLASIERRIHGKNIW